eukprot:CAMPEP_0180608914 /NCGR_PEP_ID=MMETSP1037_2-20121125/28484_1 /TAXON_ID=632150 /ORGANISM="Azadinium spinosum, Strain 3D9" /LENGTH=71 /DNA_ID=CAMNT_0022628285 /DNA_START=82 /DNA_END=293 /DNA_ORIENTATION=+
MSVHRCSGALLARTSPPLSCTNGEASKTPNEAWPTLLRPLLLPLLPVPHGQKLCVCASREFKALDPDIRTT